MDTLEQEICNCAERSGFSGVIRISGGDKLVFKGAWGFRNRGEQLPVGAATRFAIASGTKLFTSLAIGRLVQQGRLALDSAVGDLHADFCGWIDPAATIEQLLTHNSGCYDYLDEETIEDYENFRVDIPWCYLETPLDYLPLFVGQAMKAAAGSGYCYSNGGYVALGILIETQSGRLYRDFVRDEVLLPAGMHDSGFFAFDELPSDTALGYLNDGLRTNIYKVPLRGGGDGGMYTTAPDLERFWKALLAGKILESPLLDAWLRPRLQIANQYWSACGLTRRTDNDSYSIVGGDHGVGFDSRYLPRSGITLSILSNQSDGEEEMRELILELLG